MKRFLAVVTVAAALATGAFAAAQSMSQNGLASLPTAFASQAARACIFPAGGWTTVDCSNSAAASSGQLDAWTRYAVQCRSDTYLSWGTAATGQDADTSDGYLPEGAWLEFITTDSVRYLSCRNVTTDTDCRYIQCK